MIRNSALTLKFATSKKLNTLDLVFDEYARIVNLCIDALRQSKVLPKFTNFKVDTWISAQLQQVAGKQAVENLFLLRFRKLFYQFVNPSRL